LAKGLIQAAAFQATRRILSRALRRWAAGS